MTPQPNVRLYYKLIQCLHHKSIAADQQAGNWSKAFKRKNQQLNEFIRPAYPNQQIYNQITAINANWTGQILDALHLHYVQSIETLSNNIKSAGHTNNDNDIDIALTRAKRKFGKKLRLETIKSFMQICKDAKNCQPNTTKVQMHEQEGQGTQEVFHSPQTKRSPVAKPNKSCNGSTSKSQDKPNKEPVAKQKQPTPKYRYNTRSSVKIQSQTINTNVPLKGVTNVHVSTKDKFKVWRLNHISRPTLIMGDSNLRSINQKVDNVEIQSYPGAKFMHMTHLIKSYPHAAYKPERKIVSVGLNDHPNQFQTTKHHFDEMCVALKKKFPSSQIYVPQINVPGDLPRNGTQKLNHLNEYLSKRTDIGVIPKLNKEDFILDQKNYHWICNTGNKFLKHWLGHLNL